MYNITLLSVTMENKYYCIMYYIFNYLIYTYELDDRRNKYRGCIMVYTLKYKYILSLQAA